MRRESRGSGAHENTTAIKESELAVAAGRPGEEKKSYSCSQSPTLPAELTHAHAVAHTREQELRQDPKLIVPCPRASGPGAKGSSDGGVRRATGTAAAGAGRPAAVCAPAAHGHGRRQPEYVLLLLPPRFRSLHCIFTFS